MSFFSNSFKLFLKNENKKFHQFLLLITLQSKGVPKIITPRLYLKKVFPSRTSLPQGHYPTHNDLVGDHTILQNAHA